jgi:hypothetical protein
MREQIVELLMPFVGTRQLAGAKKVHDPVLDRKTPPAFLARDSAIHNNAGARLPLQGYTTFASRATNDLQALRSHLSLPSYHCMVSLMPASREILGSNPNSRFAF